MAQQEVESNLCVDGIILRATRGEGLAVPGKSRGIDRKQDEDVVLEKRGDDRALRELEADRDLATAEALAKALRPGLDATRLVRQNGTLQLVATGRREAQVVLAVGPIDADERGEVRIGFLHMISSNRIGDGTCKAGPSEGDMVSR